MTERLRHWKRGDSLTAAHLDEPVQALNRMAASGGNLSAGNVRPGDEILCVVVSVHKDHLVCYRKKNGTLIRTPLKVAKPYPLRYTPFEGKTINVEGTDITFTYDATNPEKKRVATDGTNSDTQEIQIPYVVYVGDGADDYQGDEIWVKGVSIEAGLQTDDGERLMLRDINDDGRAWAKQ